MRSGLGINWQGVSAKCCSEHGLKAPTIVLSRRHTLPGLPAGVFAGDGPSMMIIVHLAAHAR